jgi:TonB family protein
LNEERIPSKILNQPEALAWVAHQLHASRLVFGTIRTEKEVLLARAHLLKDEGPGKKPHVGKEISVKMPLGNLADGLLARESLPPPAKRDISQMNAEPVDKSRISQKDFKFPSCFYMPNPPYTQSAREAKLSGTLLIEAIITRQGEITNPRILRGLPFGMNQFAIETMKSWRCHPAIDNGVPIAVVVPFEVTFRLY